MDEPYSHEAIFLGYKALSCNELLNKNTGVF